MIRSIIQASMNARYLVIGVAVAAIVAAGASLLNMPVDVLPEFSPPIVEIQTEALGLSAEEVEALITTPLEADLLNGVAWLDTLSSESVTGLSSIILQFEPGTDPIRARQMVQERLTQAHALPNVSQPPLMLQPLSSTNRVMMIGLTSEQLSLIDMSVLARWTIKPRLLGVPGVANVAIWGQRERQLQVLVDPKQLSDEGVTLQQVINTSGNALWVSPLSFLNASTPGTGGWIDTPNQRLGVRHLLPITNAEELARVTVEGAEALRLGDVAQVVEDHQPLIGDALVNGDSGLLLVVEKFPGENTVAVTRGVEEALANLAPGLGGIDINTELFRPATFIELATANLRTALIVGGILVLLVLLVAFFDWRSALIGLVAIPLSLLAALWVLDSRGATMNMLVLAGLVVALGILLAHVVGQVHTTMRHLREARESKDERSAAQVILDSTLLSNRNAVFATLIVLVAVVPVVVVTGLPGTLFRTLILSYALAAVASVVVALIVTPTLCLALFARLPSEADGSDIRRIGDDSALAGGIRRSYGRNLIERPTVALVLGAVLLVAALVVLPRVNGAEHLPTVPGTSLLIRWKGEPTTSRAAMADLAGQVSAELMKIAGVTNVTANVGRAVTSDQVVDIDSSEIWVRFDPQADYSRVRNAVEAVIGNYPALAGGATTYLRDITDAAQSGNGDGLVVRVYGNEYDVLEAEAERVRQAVAGVRGVARAQPITPVETSRLEIQVYLDAVERVGLKPGDVRRTAATLLSGIQVGNLFEEQKVFDVVVWGKPQVRESVESIENLLIDTPFGSQVRLADVARVAIVSAPSVIRRQGVSRYIDIAVDVDGRAAAVADRVDAAIADITFPIEIHAELLDDYAVRQRDRRDLLSLGAIALIVIFLLLQAAFRSWRLALVSFLALAGSLAGGVLVTGVAGLATTASLAGLLAVLGIAATNIMLLIGRYTDLEREREAAGDGARAELVLAGTRDQLMPVLAIALATALAVLPFVFFGAGHGFELLRPMAYVVLGGLVTSTLVGLFVVPGLYLRARAEPEAEFDFSTGSEWLQGRGSHAAAD